MIPPPPNQLPARVGRFDIVERLAIGGMAEVYLAREVGAHGLTRLVVVKRILPHLAIHESMVRMFLQEARIAARINHPNVVQILELGEEGGYPFIAMEYLPGSSLRDLIMESRRQKRTIPVAVALHLVAQACAGAHAAHEMKDPSGKPANLVHRDLTPHNLMVDAEGHVKLLDFGIAKASDDQDHTRTGMLKGKIRYMSPEQCNQEELDRRSDVFSLGIVAWEMLGGERLFERATELATMQAITTGEIKDLRKHRPEVPEPVVLAIEQALRVNRDDRHPTADAMRRALLAAASDAGLVVNQDVAAAFIGAVLGPRHLARAAHIEEALERANQSTYTPPPTLDLTGTGMTSHPTSHPTQTMVTPMRMVGAAGAVVAFATIGLATLTIALAVAVFWGGVAGPTDSAAAVAPEVVPTGPPVVIGLAPVQDPAVMVGEYEPLRRHLEKRLDRPVKTLVASSYGEVGRMVAEGDVHFAVLPPYIYLETVGAHPEVKLVAMKMFDGSSGTDGVLLVREDAVYSKAADLRGRTICYTDVDSSTGYLLPRAWLRAEGLDPDRDLVAHASGNHFQAMRDLEAGTCEVAGTYSGAWLSADRAGVSAAKMRVLAITGRTPHDAVVATPGLDAALVAEVGEILLSLDPKAELGVDRIGEVERITGFAAGEDARFDELRAAIAAEQKAAAAARQGKKKPR